MDEHKPGTRVAGRKVDPVEHNYDLPPLPQANDTDTYSTGGNIGIPLVVLAIFVIIFILRSKGAL